MVKMNECKKEENTKKTYKLDITLNAACYERLLWETTCI